MSRPVISSCGGIQPPADLAVNLAALQTGFASIAERFRHGLADCATAPPPPGDAAGLEIHHCLPISCIAGGPRTRDDPDRDRLNHRAETTAISIFGDIPFHHLPVTKETKREQETAIWNLVGQTEPISLAGALHANPLGRDVGETVGAGINIHHSFLPGFKAPSLIIRRTSAASN